MSIMNPRVHIVTWLTIDRVWIGNWVYWTLKTRNYKYLRQSHWVAHPRDNCNYSTHKNSSVFTCHCLVTASTADVPLPWVPELSPASATSFSLLTIASLNWVNSNSTSKLCYNGPSVLVM
jgi:hypothetical protein